MGHSPLHRGASDVGDEPGGWITGSARDPKIHDLLGPVVDLSKELLRKVFPGIKETISGAALLIDTGL